MDCKSVPNPARRRLLTASLALPMVATGGAAAAFARDVESLLIRGAYVMTMDPALGDIPVGDVLITRGRIVDVGHNVATPANTRVMAGLDKIVLPGFVDVHSHLWITQLRGRYGNTPASRFAAVRPCRRCRRARGRHHHGRGFFLFSTTRVIAGMPKPRWPACAMPTCVAG
jgi:hypothetical protein